MSHAVSPYYNQNACLDSPESSRSFPLHVPHYAVRAVTQFTNELVLALDLKRLINHGKGVSRHGRSKTKGAIEGNGARGRKPK